MNYRFKKSSYINVDAQVAGEICESLGKNNQLSAKALVDVSRAEDAPLHDAFEWDDSVAGELYREGQARHIIASLEVVSIGSNEPVRAFFAIERKEPEYKHINMILENENDTEKLLNMAYRELQAFQRKYSQLERLNKVFQAINELDISV